MEGLGGDRAGSCNPGVEAGLCSVGAVDAAAATAAAAAAPAVAAGGLGHTEGQQHHQTLIPHPTEIPPFFHLF